MILYRFDLDLDKISLVMCRLSMSDSRLNFAILLTHLLFFWLRFFAWIIYCLYVILFTSLLSLEKLGYLRLLLLFINSLYNNFLLRLIIIWATKKWLSQWSCGLILFSLLLVSLFLLSLLLISLLLLGLFLLGLLLLSLSLLGLFLVGLLLLSLSLSGLILLGLD